MRIRINVVGKVGGAMKAKKKTGRKAAPKPARKTARKAGRKAEQKTKKPSILALARECKKLSRANKKLNERVLELYTLYNISKTLSLYLQLDELFETTMKVIRDTMNVTQFNIMLLDDTTGSLYMQAAHGFEDDLVRKAILGPGEGLPGMVLKNNKIVHLEDMGWRKDFVYAEGEKKLKGCYLGVPLRRPGGPTIGVLNAHKTKRSSFGKDDIHLFEAVSEHVAIALENARQYQRTKELSNRDDLTGLYNRRYFFERFEREVERAKRYNRCLSIILMDLDHFKRYNDTFGHLSGDRALQAVANVLRENIRKVDIVSRYGGEEFVVVLPETDKESTVVVAEKLRKAVEKLHLGAEKGGEPLTITAGVSGFPLDATDALELLEASDKALYFGKAQGRNRVCAKIFERAP